MHMKKIIFIIIYIWICRFIIIKLHIEKYTKRNHKIYDFLIVLNIFY